MGKEYTYLADYYLSCVIREMTDLSKEGWKLINIFHDGRDYVAVLERNK